MWPLEDRNEQFKEYMQYSGYLTEYKAFYYNTLFLFI